MPRAPRTTPVTEDTNPEELLVEGEEALAAEEETEEEVDVGDEPAPEPQAVRTNPMDHMVSIDRVNELNARLQEQQQLITAMASRLAPAQAAQPSTPSYVRPNDPEDVRKWREFVGQTADPVVDAKVAEVRRYVDTIAAQAGEAIDLQAVRAEFPDYDQHAQEVEALRANFQRQTGQPVQRRWAYLAVQGLKAVKRSGDTRGKAVRRTTAAAATSSKPPQGPARPKLGAAVRTVKDVKALPFEELEKLAMASNAPV